MRLFSFSNSVIQSPGLLYSTLHPISQRGLGRNYSKAPSIIKAFGDAREASLVGVASQVGALPNLHGLPEVSFVPHRVRRANAGKSTLLNAVIGRRNLLFTSKKAGRTQTLNFFRVGGDPGRLVVVDSPGYGARGRPEWGAVFDDYIRNRNELRRVFILLNAKQGLTDVDAAMLEQLGTSIASRSTDSDSYGSAKRSSTPVSIQPIITKCDSLGANGRARVEAIAADVREAAPPECLVISPPIVTACQTERGLPPFGIDAVRQSILEACMGISGR
ncbi:hypothetical protein CONPUDRAFT_126699 [Coniophora puteana RWD-64-598 SS2]|uniref:G domain-containing protein n=1 Tax=Coniophora puteana (strain RWD-64-598) TaxID=741705 RepID=A0A5M3MJW0_CONPW|nr:uncharacterized protein CONPUDRAFT_126699 [Coniophora puteana RWD-64-598 SS2]EIW78945.1 hypothetical protein CONPUDRAFT_126699 [Coniophora puteana RWD-64-598 SS2]